MGLIVWKSFYLCYYFRFSVSPKGSVTFIVTVGGWVDGWAYLSLKIFRAEKLSFENIYFSDVLISLYFFGCQQGNFRACRSKIARKIDTFGNIDTRVLANLGGQKS